MFEILDIAQENVLSGTTAEIQLKQIELDEQSSFLTTFSAPLAVCVSVCLPQGYVHTRTVIK